MLTRRIIPCLDVDGGRVVKGVRFQNLRPLGDPVDLARRYAAEGADELVFLDISATIEERRATLAVVEQVARAVSIPLTVGGGIRSVNDARDALRAGADKVAVNSAAVADPSLLERLAREFGSQCVVLAVDARRRGPGSWEVVTHAGQRPSGRDVIAWCREATGRGAGEILLTSIDQDGTRSGYDLDLIQAVVAAVTVPVIASGGAGRPEHLADALHAGADAVLAASIFHECEWTVGRIKRILQRMGLPVRLDPRDGEWLEEIRWNEAGLVPVVVEADDGARMLGYADRAALEKMIETGYLWLYSRSRRRLWMKGETSGNRQRVLSIDLDCDGDAVRIRVAPEGPTCHTGADSCFSDRVWTARAAASEGPAADLASVLSRLEETITDRLQRKPEGSYVARLAADPDLARRKVGEEAVEWILATVALERTAGGGNRNAGGDDDQRDLARQAAVHEAADLLFHWLVSLRLAGIASEEVARELARRAKPRDPRLLDRGTGTA